MKSKRLVKLATAAAIVSALNGVARASDFGSMAIFGDSLSDVGNAYNTDFHLSPASPYYNGRWSNGSLWVEDLASELSLSAPTPSTTTSSGRDYAYGGVHTGSGTIREVIFNFPNIGTQISSYLSSNTPAANGLFTIWGGANDFIDGQTDPSVPVNNIAAHVTALANAGAKTIIVPNLPALGETPRFRGTANESMMNSLSGQFDSILQTTLTSLASSLHIHIDQLDVAGLLAGAIANPAAYGFTNVTTPADNNGTVVPNPDQYLFFDDIHPTRVGHQLIANAAFDLVTTHNWIAGAASASFGTAGNWDPANAVDATWIANVANTSTSPRTASVSTSATVRQIRVSGFSSGGGTGTMTVSIQSGVTLAASQIATIGSAGVIELQSTATLNCPTITIQSGGQLGGSGTIAGSVSNSGIIAPTGTAKNINITGSFTQTSNGAIQVDLAGADSGQFSTMRVSQQATLDGDLSVSASNGFEPLPGETFNILSFATRSGTVTISDDTAYPGLRFNANYTSTSLTLTADAIAGDANLDGVVNALDFNALASNFGGTGELWTQGDFNDDGVTNTQDFTALATNFNLTLSSTPAVGALVPEPLAIAFALAPVVLRRRAGRRRVLNSAPNRRYLRKA